MPDNILPSQSPEQPKNQESGGFEKPETKEQSPETKERIIEKPIEREERVAPTIEQLKTSISVPSSVQFQQRDLTDEEGQMIEKLVAVTIKNPDIEKGLEDANRQLNTEIKKIKKQGRDFSYIIDEFHDRLVEKMQEMNLKLDS